MKALSVLSKDCLKCLSAALGIHMEILLALERSVIVILCCILYKQAIKALLQNVNKECTTLQESTKNRILFSFTGICCFRKTKEDYGPWNNLSSSERQRIVKLPNRPSWWYNQTSKKSWKITNSLYLGFDTMQVWSQDSSLIIITHGEVQNNRWESQVDELLISSIEAWMKWNHSANQRMVATWTRDSILMYSITSLSKQ